MKTLFYTVALLMICGFIAPELSAQNTCGTAQVIDLINDSQFSGSTVGVSSDNATSGAPSCGLALGTGGQKWYQFTFSGCSTASLRLNTCMAFGLTTFDTQIHVYSGSCGNLNCVAQDDDSGCELTSDVTFTIVPGVTYRVRVGGYAANSGTFFLNVVFDSGGCVDPSACNYSSYASWDDCSCYYSSLAELETDIAPGVPAGGTIVVYQPIGGIYGPNVIETGAPGVLAQFCEADLCGLRIAFYLPDGATSWLGSTYSLTIHGNTFSGVIPDPGAETNSVVIVEDPTCGCTEPSAINYTSDALYDDGTCESASLGSSCMNPHEMLWGTAIYMDLGFEPLNIIELYPGEYALGKDKWCSFTYQGGAIRISAHGGDPVIYVKDACGGNVLYYMDDFTQGVFISLNPVLSLSCDDGLVPGETYYIQTLNLNYNSDYVVELGLTHFPGCTDPLASNYNACASIDDGSCDTCPADLDNSGVVNVTDLLQFVSAYGTSCN